VGCRIGAAGGRRSDGGAQQVVEIGAPPTAVVAGGGVGPGPVGGLVQHSGQDEDLDCWHVLGDLAAAVVEFVAVVVAGVGGGGDDGQQVDQLADLVAGEPLAVHDDPL
jgi:hypothetical protein